MLRKTKRKIKIYNRLKIEILFKDMFEIQKVYTKQTLSSSNFCSSLLKKHQYSQTYIAGRPPKTCLQFNYTLNTFFEVKSTQEQKDFFPEEKNRLFLLKTISIPNVMSLLSMPCEWYVSCLCAYPALNYISLITIISQILFLCIRGFFAQQKCHSFFDCRQ